MLQQILSRFSGKVLFEVEAKNIKVALELAVSKGANLQRANLREANLQKADLQKANLQVADFQGANLQEVNLQVANLREANLQKADLQKANLQVADLWGANLQRANLRGADLQGTNLWGANLQRANLRGADLQGTNLWEANLWGAENIPSTEIKRRANCPLAGEFTAWKKGNNGEIIKLKIPVFARRVSPITGRKCRAECAIVLEIEDKNGKQIAKCTGGYDLHLKYQVGEFVSPDSYDASPLIECSHGIHFFVTRQEAMDW